MLDQKFIRENSDSVKRAIADKGETANVDAFLELDKERRGLLIEADELRHARNVTSEEIGRLKSQKEDASEKIKVMQEVAQQIKDLEQKIREVETNIETILLTVPNMPHSSVPVGTSEANNVEIRRWGEKRDLGFEPLPHWEIGERLEILDFGSASRMSGSGFVILQGLGAKLERALINFMLDLHVRKHGYTELSPPFLVNRRSMVNTGQLPKLEEDMYECEQDGFFLIPTGEVPVTNVHQDDILKEKELPKYYATYTPCFRREAGSYGKETRGLIRVHQFDKVEMVKFVRPETSYDELESLLKDAEEVLQLLDLHYRVVSLCTADLSFAAAKCYDIEVWAPGVGKYLEVSSCSNFEAFQARRASIRFRREDTGKVEFVHTLNGSGLALPRTVIALLENYQTEKGTVVVPEVLRKYMDDAEILC
ncbi:MAG: serine--tRNA ligase [Gemmatimonadota bacterium]|nr:MAG: serine--tRNA ligase [Gemmatimonadota bacterium]